MDVPTVSGGRRQVARQGFGTEQEAAAALAEVVLKADGRRPAMGPDVTVGEWVEQWLADQALRVSPATWRTYRTACRRIATGIGSVNLRDVSSRQVTAFSSSLVNGQDGSAPVASTTARNMHMVLHKVLADAVRLEMIPWNPADGATPPSVERGSYTVWTADQMVEFFAFIRSHRLYPLFVMLATTGMRRGEALGLRWRWVDLEDRSLSIVSSLGDVGGRVVESVPKTRAARRRVDLDVDTVGVLQSVHDERAARHGRVDPDAFVFTDRHGESLRPATVSTTFDRLVASSGLPRIRLHDVRHTYATLAVEAGMHPEVLTERLGHSTVATTLDMYVHVSSSVGRASADVVAGQFFGRVR